MFVVFLHLLVCSLSRPGCHLLKAGGLKQTAPQFHQQRPDIDNLEKLVLDSLSGSLLADDAAVATTTAVKSWALPGHAGSTQVGVASLIPL
jgi:hypothetical protein